MDGTELREFEPDDLTSAEQASDAVKEYCSGVKSEAHTLAASHVTEDDLP